MSEPVHVSKVTVDFSPLMPDYQDSWIMGWIKGIFQWYSCENIAHSRQGHINLRTENTLNRR